MSWLGHRDSEQDLDLDIVLEKNACWSFEVEIRSKIITVFIESNLALNKSLEQTT